MEKLFRTPTSSSQSLKAESKTLHHLTICFLLTSLSGFITYFYQNHTEWQQLNFLLHTATGIVLTALLAPYIYFHYKRTVGFKAIKQFIIGWLSILIFSALVFTGLHITIVGQYESLRWVYDVHIIAAFLFVLFIAAHILFFIIARRLQLTEKSSSQTFSRTFSKPTAIHSVKHLFIWSTIIIAGSLALAFTATEPFTNQQNNPDRYVQPYGDGPFLPSQAATPDNQFIDELYIGRSDKCKNCHEQITEEWQSSMHARSASDMFFQRNLHSLVAKQGTEAARYCAGCHIPTALLTGKMTKGINLKEGPHIDEGIGCMSCHGIRSAVHLKGVGSYFFEPAQNYIFNNSDNVVATAIHDFTLKINPRQHREDMAKSNVDDPKNCATCHEQYIDKDLNDWGWVKLQRQYISWLEGPFSGQSDQTFSHQKETRCQDCHFPLTKGDDPSADAMGLQVSHQSPAANTAVPFLLNDTKQLELVKSFLTNDRISMTIQEPIITDDSLTVDIAVSSHNIGHHFPAGTIDLNEPWIEVIVTDSKGTTLDHSGLVGRPNIVDPFAYFYYSKLIDKRGEHVFKHDLFNAVGESYLKLLPPGGSDVANYKFFFDTTNLDTINISARLRYRKFNQIYTNWALREPGMAQVKLPIVDMASDSISVKLDKKQ